MVSVWTASPGNTVRSAPQRHLFVTASVAYPRCATWSLNAPAGPGRITKSALARVLDAEWRERISVHKAAMRQMHCAPGPAGVVRTQKLVIWPPKKTGIQARWYSIRVGYGTLVATPEVENSRFWWILMPAGHPRTSPSPGPA
eukprot:gene12948-biopygen16978